MSSKDGSLDALLQKSWGSLRTGLPFDPSLLLDPRAALAKTVVCSLGEDRLLWRKRFPLRRL